MSDKIVPEGKFVDVGDGLRVHFQEEGAGAPLVFLHGSGPGASGWSNFRRNYPFFAERGFRALVPDTLGFGYSSKPDVNYGMDFVVGALTRFLDAVGAEKVALVGNSHGGAMAIQFALQFPERTSHLVLMAPGGLEERETYMEMEGIRAMLRATLGTPTSPASLTRESLRRVFALQLHDPALLTDDIIEERFQIAETQPPRVFTTLAVPHLAPELSKLRCPVFAWWGVDDRFCPVSGAMRIAESCAGARVMVLNQCGHWVMVEHAALFNRTTLDFLEMR